MTKLTIWEGDTGTAATALKAQVSGYNSTFRTCQATTDCIAATGHEFTPKLPTALSSGSGPNLVLSYSEPQDMAEVAATGDVIALNNYMSKDVRPRSDFYPAMLKASTFSGKVYSFPTDGGDYAILYNKEIFKEAGITATPTTWAQVAADSAKITSSEKGVYGFYVPFGVNEWTVWTFESMLWSEGGHFLNNHGTEARSTAGTFVTLAFIYNWNNFFYQFIIVGSNRFMTVQLGLVLFQSQQTASEFNLLMAASTIAVVPVLIVFLIFQRQIVRGIMLGGLN